MLLDNTLLLTKLNILIGVGGMRKALSVVVVGTRGLRCVGEQTREVETELGDAVIPSQFGQLWVPDGEAWTT